MFEVSETHVTDNKNVHNLRIDADSEDDVDDDVHGAGSESGQQLELVLFCQQSPLKPRTELAAHLVYYGRHLLQLGPRESGREKVPRPPPLLVSQTVQVLPHVFRHHRGHPHSVGEHVKLSDHHFVYQLRR